MSVTAAAGWERCATCFHKANEDEQQSTARLGVEKQNVFLFGQALNRKWLTWLGHYVPKLSSTAPHHLDSGPRL